MRKIKQRAKRRQNNIAQLIDAIHDGNVAESAKAVGMTTSTLWRLYSRARSRPRLETLQPLADFYGLPIALILRKKELHAGNIRMARLAFLSYQIRQTKEVLKDLAWQYQNAEHRWEKGGR